MHKILSFLDQASASVRLLGSIAPAVMKNRLELFALELKEEGYRITALLVWLLLILFFFGLFVIMVTVGIILAVPNEARIWVIWGLTLLYALLGMTSYAVMRRILRKSPRPFAATLEEFEKDKQCF